MLARKTFTIWQLLGITVICGLGCGLIVQYLQLHAILNRSDNMLHSSARENIVATRVLVSDWINGRFHWQFAAVDFHEYEICFYAGELSGTPTDIPGQCDVIGRMTIGGALGQTDNLVVNFNPNVGERGSLSLAFGSQIHTFESIVDFNGIKLSGFGGSLMPASSSEILQIPEDSSFVLLNKSARGEDKKTYGFNIWLRPL